MVTYCEECGRGRKVGGAVIFLEGVDFGRGCEEEVGGGGRGVLEVGKN